MSIFWESKKIERRLAVNAEFAFGPQFYADDPVETVLRYSSGKYPSDVRNWSVAARV